MGLKILMVNKLLELFMRKNCKKFRIGRVIKKEVLNYMLNGKDLIIHLIAGLIKRYCKMNTKK